jgi:hypothetical protein
LGGAVDLRVIFGFAVSDLPPKKKFLMEDKADGLDCSSGLSLGSLLPSP